MKAGRQLIELSFCIVCALAPSALWTLDAVPAADPSIKPTQVSDRNVIHGAVSAKAETRLTVNGKVIVTTVATTVMKDGRPATLDDIKVGDTVTVTAAKVAGDSLQAVSVEATNHESTHRPSG
jgi:hypothetical protein